MHILITGAAGMIGRKLTDRLIRDGGLNDKPILKLTLADIVTPPSPSGFSGEVDLRTCDLSRPDEAKKIVSGAPNVIFHLAAVVSGEAEADLEKGYRINLDGTRALIEALRQSGDGGRTRFIFTSSVAVFGAPFPPTIDDDFHLTPLTSYGAQKAMGELLVADYSRRGLLDGVGIRLPTICVRPGKPNKAASGFFSSIMREPLIGEEAVLPVPETVRHIFASPRSAVGFLVHAASLTREVVGPRVNLTMPAVSCTVGEQIEALRRTAGDRVAARIRREPDPTITQIVGGWPMRLAGQRAQALGFRAETTFEEILRVHIEDELGGRIAA